MKASTVERDRLRPVDVAREHGLSAQAIRNYEEAGILPAAERTQHGYRVYRPLHAQALRTFLALRRGHGHRTSTEIMRAVHRDAVDDAFALIDESHAELRQDRETLTSVRRALPGLAEAEPGTPPAGDLFIGPLAHQLGLRPATLRKWERAGLLRPEREPGTGYRRYTADDVRDARLAHQLRRGGYPLHRIAEVLAQVRDKGGVAPLTAALGDWRDRLTARARAMLTGAAELDRYLRMR